MTKKISALQVPPDVIINGQISSDTDVSASIDASYSCVFGSPEGTATGTFQTPVGSFTFSSDSITLISAVNEGGIQKTGAIFANVTVTETGGPTITGCTLFINGLRLSSGTWEGSFSISQPEVLGLVVLYYGTFTGVLNTARSVFCTD